MSLGGIEYAILALAAVGTGTAVYSGVQQSRAAKEMGKYNEKVAQNEALARRQAAEESMRRKRETNRRIIANQQAKMAKAGIISSEGTPLAVLGETAGALELEALDIMYETEVAAQRSISAGQAARFQGDQASKSALIGAGSSLLTGAGNMASTYVNLKDKGYFGGGETANLMA